jgi:hypothetical protein
MMEAARLKRLWPIVPARELVENNSVAEMATAPMIQARRVDLVENDRNREVGRFGDFKSLNYS